MSKLTNNNKDTDLKCIIGSVKVCPTKNGGINNPTFENDTVSVNDKAFKFLPNFGNDEKEPKRINENSNIKDEDCRNNEPIALRNFVSYYLLGLCNNFGFFVMLSAANDIIDEFDDEEKKRIHGANTGRICHILSTGTILLADVLPGLIIKLIAPFLPFYVNLRVSVAVSMAIIGYLLVGISETKFFTILGIIMTSASSCLGESTFLSYSSNYNKNIVAVWSAGGAGIAGSLTYAALRSLNVSQRSTILLMIIIPIIECISFWLILRHPKKLLKENSVINKDNSIIENCPENNISDELLPEVNLFEKLKFLGCLLKYMIPLITIYFAQYFINQGLASQYRWLIVNYQIGVLIARSTATIFSIKPIWIMSILQLLNVIYFLMEAIFYITPSIWITFVIVIWEGLLGGGGYAYTFYNISKEVRTDRKRFAMGFVSISDTIGITIAGFAAISVNNAICTLPAPVRL